MQCSSSWLQVFGHAHFLGCACLVTLVFLSVLLPVRGMPLPRQSATRQREGCTCKGSWLQVLRHAHVSGHVCVRCVLKACRRCFWPCLISWLQVLVMLAFSGSGCPRKARCCQGCLPEGTRQAALAAACPEQAASSAHKHTHTHARRNLLLPARPAPEVAGWRQVSRNARILGCRFLVMLNSLAARVWSRLCS